jgi:hypothetical protein
VKQNNWQLNLVFNYFRFFIFILLLCLTPASNSEIPHFKQQSNNSASAKAYRTDSFNRIYDNRNRFKQLKEVQLAAELAKLIVIQKQLNPEVINSDLPADNKIHANTNSSTELSSINGSNTNTGTSDSNSSSSKNLQAYPAHYNPFAHGDLNEFVYDTRVFLKTRYREAQEAKFPYLAKLRREREQKENLQRAAREQAHKQAIAIALIRDYNRRPNNLNLPEQFCSAKFNNSEQQNLHNRQIEIVCELADREIFPKNIIGLQDFSDTVLETVSLAYQANRKELIVIAKNFTDLAQDFLALGQGLARGGYNFVGNIVNAGSNLIIDPINTTKAVANNIASLTKKVTFSLIKTAVLLLDFDPNHLEFKFYTSALHDYGSEPYQQFWNYVETVPRIQKFEQVGEFVSEQTLSLIASFLTGKAVSLVSDSVIAAQLHKAVAVKKKADKAKSEKISWFNKFGAPGKDVARTLGLVVAEEYELAELNGLIVSFKNGPANNQTLFNHADEYFKHNKSGKKAKHKSAIKTAPDEIKPARIMGPQMSLQERKLKADQIAKSWGAREYKGYSSDSRNAKVYRLGNKLISLDVDAHNGGFWKMMDMKERRLGTYDETLTKFIRP